MAPTLVFALALFWPLALVVSHGFSLVGRYEESVGYRYFYSLRRVYGDEYVFAAQGQLCDLMYQTLQALLTILGFAPDTTTPRIDWFAYLAVAVAHAGASVAFAWAGGSLRSVAARLLLAVVWLLPYYLEGVDGHVVLLQPDYQPWIVTVGLASLAILSRTSWETPWRLREAAALGMLLGLSASVKITLVMFPGAIVLAWFLARPQRSRSARFAALTGSIGIAVWLGVLFLVYNGHPSYVARFFRDLRQFVDSAEAGVGYVAWMSHVVLGPPWMVSAAAVLPALLVGAAVLSRMPARRTLALSLLTGAAGYHWLLYRRFTPTTWFEAVIFLEFAASALIVGWPHAGRVLAVSRAAVTVTCLLLIAGRVPYMLHYIGSVGTNDAANAALREAKATRGGRVAFLVPDNSFRPLSIDSAIYKGGSDIFTGRFGASPRVRALAPAQEYFAATADQYRREPLDLTGFSAVIFTLPRTVDLDVATQRGRLETHFGTSLALFRCDSAIDFSDQTVMVCDRREDVVAAPTDLKPLFAPAVTRIDAASEVVDAAGRARPVGPEGVVVSGRSGQMVRLDRDGGVTRIVTTEGRRLWIANAGAWDPARARFAGLGATYVGGRWRFDDVPLAALNGNAYLMEIDVTGMPRGFRVRRSNAVKVQHLIGDDGSAVRLEARRRIDLSVESTAILMGDAPEAHLSVRARVRASPGSLLRLTIHEVASDSRRIRVAHAIASESGQVLTLPGVRPFGPGGHAISVGLVNAEPGQWLELRELGLYMATLPS